MGVELSWQAGGMYGPRLFEDEPKTSVGISTVGVGVMIQYNHRILLAASSR